MLIALHPIFSHVRERTLVLMSKHDAVTDQVKLLREANNGLRLQNCFLRDKDNRHSDHSGVNLPTFLLDAFGCLSCNALGALTCQLVLICLLHMPPKQLDSSLPLSALVLA